MPVWLPFHSSTPRGVGLGADEPQRAAVVVRRGDPLALGVERDAGDGRGVLEALQRLAAARTRAPSCPPRRPADGVLASPNAATCSTHLEPKRAISATSPPGPTRRKRPSSPPVTQPPRPSAAMRQHRPVMRRDADPLALGRRDPHRAVAKREGRASRPRTRRRRRTRPAPASSPAPGAGYPARALARGLAEKGHHPATWHASNPRRSCGRFRLRPMNTSFERRSAPSGHGPMKSPSAIMCTAWKAKRRSSFG